MATKIGDAFVEIGAKSDKMTPGLNSAKGKVDGWLSGMAGTVGKGIGLGVGIGIASIGAKILANLWGMVEKSVQEFAKAEDVIVGYDAALKSVGSVQTIGQATDMATAFQKLTRMTNEQVLSLQQYARNLGATDANINDFTKSAIGLGRALGMDVHSAMREVMNATEGAFGMLQRYIPELRNAKDEHEKLAIVMAKANAGFTQEMAMTKTLNGTWGEFKDTMGDFSEKVGGAFVKVFHLAGLGRGLTSIVEKLTGTGANASAMKAAQESAKLTLSKEVEDEKKLAEAKKRQAEQTKIAADEEKKLADKAKFRGSVSGSFADVIRVRQSGYTQGQTAFRGDRGAFEGGGRTGLQLAYEIQEWKKNMTRKPTMTRETATEAEWSRLIEEVKRTNQLLEKQAVVA